LSSQIFIQFSEGGGGQCISLLWFLISDLWSPYLGVCIHLVFICFSRFKILHDDPISLTDKIYIAADLRYFLAQFFWQVWLQPDPHAKIYRLKLETKNHLFFESNIGIFELLKQLSNFDFVISIFQNFIVIIDAPGFYGFLGRKKNSYDKANLCWDVAGINSMIFCELKRFFNDRSINYIFSSFRRFTHIDITLRLK